LVWRGKRNHSNKVKEKVMYRNLIALLIVIAIAPAVVDAAGPGKGGGNGGGKGASFKYGGKSGYGGYSHGHGYNHWSYRCWNGNYGCYCYWDAGCSQYFYYCQPDSCYYPVTYCPYHRFSWTSAYVATGIPVATAGVGTAAPLPPAQPGGPQY
jgi:hypothetical protein